MSDEGDAKFAEFFKEQEADARLHGYTHINTEHIEALEEGDFTYTVAWSEEDHAYLSMVEGYDQFACLGATEEEALEGMKALIADLRDGTNREEFDERHDYYIKHGRKKPLHKEYHRG